MLSCYYGTDSYRLRDAIADRVASARKQGIVVTALDFTEPGAQEALEREFKYPPFFGERRLIIARHAACPAFTDLLRVNTVPGDISIIAAQETVRKGIPKLFADLNPQESKEFEPLEGVALAAWLREKCGAMRITLESGVAAELTRRIGPDSGLLVAELEKLASFSHPGAISMSAVRLLTPDRKEQDDWELSNAIASLDKRRIMTALWQKVREGTPEQLLIGTCAAGLRNLLLIKDAAADGTTGSGIAKLTGLHPFVISKTLRGAVAADGHRLKTAYCALTRLDRDSKDGTADATDGLFSILLAL